MDVREFVAQSMERTRQTTLGMVKELTPAQMRWQAGPEANTIGFLVFHAFRTEDRYFHTWMTGTDEVWEREGWSNRWRLPSPPSNPDSIWTMGYGWTPQEVANWEPPPMAELLAYGQAVRESSLKLLRELDPGRLEEPMNPDHPQMTIGYFVHSGSHHEAMHQGQIDYILGLMKTAEGG